MSPGPCSVALPSNSPVSGGAASPPPLPRTGNPTCSRAAGVESIYEWGGKLEQEEECMLVIKTRSEGVPALTAAVRERHPYDEPEVLALPVAGGSQSYMDWVRASTRG